MVPKRSALNENSKVQILANDLIRRLSHADVRQDQKTTGEVVDQFGRKVLTSGYSLHQTRKIMIDGIRGWNRKKTRMLKDNSRLFRTNKESLKLRIKKKILGKTSWFKAKKKDNKENRISQGDNKEVRKYQEDSRRGKTTGGEELKSTAKDNNKKRKKEVKTTAVIFVDNTKDGELARKMRDVIERLEDILGYRIKVVERSGTPLKLMFPLSKIGQGQ